MKSATDRYRCRAWEGRKNIDSPRILVLPTEKYRELSAFARIVFSAVTHILLLYTLLSHKTSSVKLVLEFAMK